MLELRELPLAAVLESARPFFEELGEAMAGRRVVLVPGNHDHRLAEPLLEELALGGGRSASSTAPCRPARRPTRIAAWLGEAELSIAYPGIWLRDDVYATHGHYMDCHMTPAAAGVRRRGSDDAHAAAACPSRRDPADYERVLRPVYGLTYGLAEGGLGAARAGPPSAPGARSPAARNGSRVRRARRAALRAGDPGRRLALNRLLRADFDADLSAASISRSGVAAATEMCRAPGARGRARDHRPHPPRRSREDDAEWPLPGGGRLHNTGSWVFADAFHHPGTPPGPYWPGTVTWLEDEGPPRRERLLLERPRESCAEIAVGRPGQPARATRR